MSLSSDSEIKLYITQFISMVNSVIINQKWNKNNYSMVVTHQKWHLEGSEWILTDLRGVKKQAFLGSQTALYKYQKDSREHIKPDFTKWRIDWILLQKNTV